MAIKSGRVGVRTDQVDVYGRIKGVQDALDNFASEWKSTITYEAGEYVIYKGYFYKCLINNIGQIPTENIYWEHTDVADELIEQSAEIERQKILTKSVFVLLASLTWSRTSAGKYYAVFNDETFVNILSITIDDFGTLRENDNIVPVLRENGTKIGFISNVDTFYNENAYLNVKVLYKN